MNITSAPRSLIHAAIVAIVIAQSPDSAGQITERSVRAHLEFLASDALNGRGSGTRDEWIAATYIASQFRRWGLEPFGDDGGYVQQIEMTGAEATTPPVLRAGSLTLTHGKEMLLLGGLAGARTSGPLVKYQAGITIPAGAAVLMPEGAAPASAVGATLALLPETAQTRSMWEKFAATKPSVARRAVKLPPAPPGRLVGVYLDKASHAALSALAEGTSVTLAAELKPTEPSFTWNAVAKITGSDAVLSRDVIVLSAHLDHIGANPNAAGPDKINNGADDDASGTVAVMALAEALAAGAKPKRTVVFALFGSEERGGFGAGFFVDLPVVPLNQIVADLQFEMLGRPDEKVPPKTLWLTGYERSNLGAELAKQGARLVADPHPEQSFFTRSDNIRFARRGVVAHTVSSYNLHKEYHTPADEIGKIDFAHMTEAIRSLLEPVRWLANSTFKPAWAPNGCPAPCK